MSKFSTTAELVKPASQMIFAKQKSSAAKTWILAISTALTVLGAAPFAQAAIVKGTISGTWNANNINMGDSFSATYSYDDTTVNPYNFSSPGYSLTSFSAALSSLRVISGSYDHTFNFTSGVGGGTFRFQDQAYTAPTYTPVSYREVSVSAFEDIVSESNYFYALQRAGQSNGTPFSTKLAHAYALDRNANAFSNYGMTMGGYGLAAPNVNFSPDPTAVTAVPTPALLPGLAAFGLGVWRKRKQAKQVEA